MCAFVIGHVMLDLLLTYCALVQSRIKLTSTEAGGFQERRLLNAHKRVICIRQCSFYAVLLLFCIYDGFCGFFLSLTSFKQNVKMLTFIYNCSFV